MARLIRTVLAVAALATGVEVLRRAAARRSGTDHRWLAVTVNRPLEHVQQDPRVPEAFRDLGPEVETRLRPAPGDKGTEIAARLREPEPTGAGQFAARLSGADPRQHVRRALREIKSCLETGEVLLPDEPTSAPRTPGGHLVDLATRRAGGEGVL